MNKLYLIALGGKAESANIEVHDIQFAIGQSIEETFNTLLNRWYGLINKLHLDSYKELKGADGYEIKITKNRQNKVNEDSFLFLVNIGGYDPKSMLEVHRIGLYVGKSAVEVKIKAETELYQADIQQHIDNIVNVSKQLSDRYGNDYSIQLIKTDLTYDIIPDWFGYKRIDL